MTPIAALRATETHFPAGHDAESAWLFEGTIVYTADGALPVEYLYDGDRIVTRSGARTVRNIRTRATPTGTLYMPIFDEAETIYADGFQVEVPASQPA